MLKAVQIDIVWLGKRFMRASCVFKVGSFPPSECSEMCFDPGDAEIGSQRHVARNI